MLNANLSTQAAGTIFSSPKASGYLRERVSRPPDHLTRTEHNSQIRQCLGTELDNRFRREYRLDDIAHIFEVLWPSSMLFEQDIPALNYLYNQYLLSNGDLIHYQTTEVVGYIELCAVIDPAIIVAWHLAQQLDTQRSLNKSDLQRIISAQQPLFSPPAQKGRPVAENHAHLFGSYGDHLPLTTLLLQPDPQPSDDRALTELRELTSILLRYGNHRHTSDDDGGDNQLLTAVKQALQPSSICRSPLTNHWPTWQHERTHDQVDLRWLRKQIAVAMGQQNTFSASLWFYLWLWQLYRNTDQFQIRAAVLFLVSSVSQQRRKMIMEGRGLKRFMDYYAQPLRQSAPDRQNIKESALRLLEHSDDRAELKVTTSMVQSDAAAQVAEQIARLPPGLGAPKRIQRVQLRRSMEQWHYCVHFIRREWLEANPDEIWRQAAEIKNLVQAPRGWRQFEQRFNDREHSYHLMPSRLIRGLDVAGDENGVKIEPYAPALRWLRQGLQSAGPHISGLSDHAAGDTGFHLSIHAGEDYQHPLSGMRHMDETAEFCDMRAGDRFGHGLAIGIPPDQWLARQGEVILLAEEHLDNLVWAWHHATEMALHLPLASQVLPVLERRIERIRPHVPWANALKEHQPTCEDFYQAWRLRRNCKHTHKQRKQGKRPGEQLNVQLPDQDDLAQQPPSVSVELCQKRWTGTVTGLAEPKKTPARVLLKAIISSSKPLNRTSAAIITDQDSEQEILFMHALQDWLLNHYDQRGLIIEANPTSNSYISHLSAHQHHPVFRWYPPDESTLQPGAENNRFGLRRGPFKVCINTDDQGIMPTTLRTEFRLLCEAAQCHGVSRTHAEEWVERLRQTGMQIFESNHQPLWVERESL